MKPFETEYFRIIFSKQERNTDKNHKFSKDEIARIKNVVKETEDFFLNFLTFANEITDKLIYKIPVIFEKFKHETFDKKHKNRCAMLQYPPPNTFWKGANVVCGGGTAVILLSPDYKDDFESIICHELVHVFTNSFILNLNVENRTFFLEALTEFLNRFILHKKRHR